MMTIEQQVSELAASVKYLQSEVQSLKAGVAKPVVGSKPVPQEPFSAEQREKHRDTSWFDQKVRQPKSWKVDEYGEIHDKPMSHLTKKQLTKFAEMQEYAAHMEKQKPQPALNPQKTAKKGKDCYYWEDSEFRAKLARSWVAILEAEEIPAADDGDIPF